MTTFRRPEMLWHSLEHLSRCHDLDTVSIRIWVDNHVGEDPHPEIFRVIYHFATQLKNLTWSMMPRTPYNDMGPVTMAALRDGLEQSDDLVMVLEEDIMVAPEWIRWSRAVHQKLHPFCLIGIVPSEIISSGNPAQIGFGPWFSAWGCSFPRESIPSILEHDVPEYHGDQHGYCHLRWPGQEHHGGAWDGLMCRILTEEGRIAAYPHVPRCWHAGVYGHYRRRQCAFNAETLDGRVAELRERMADPAWMIAQAHDCVPCSLDIPAWSEVTT